jgi:hypothetical protein
MIAPTDPGDATIVPVPPSRPFSLRGRPPPVQPPCEARIDRMFTFTGIPLIHAATPALRWAWVAFTNAVLGAAIFCPLYYPAYYPNQALIWSVDLFLGLIIYNFLFYIQANWAKTNCLEHVEVSGHVHPVSATFYVLYIIYWFYFAVIQFVNHSTASAAIQLGNILMSTAWYLFFSTIACLYYYICIKMSQRAEDIHQWLKGLKEDSPALEQFFAEHNIHHKKVKAFSRHWSFIIFLGFLLLSFHVPIDLLSIVYAKNYYDTFGLVLKLFSLGWYTARICALNDYDARVVSYLLKHRIFSTDEMAQVEAYVVHRPIGLVFYGIRINRGTVIKFVLLVLNLIVPTVYALLSNKIFGT